MAADTVATNWIWRRNIQFHRVGLGYWFILFWLLQSSICTSEQQYAYIYEQERYLLPCSTSLYLVQNNSLQPIFANPSQPSSIKAEFTVASMDSQPFITIRTNDTSLNGTEFICCQSEQWCPGSPASFRFILLVISSSSRRFQFKNLLAAATSIHSELIIEMLADTQIQMSCLKSNIALSIWYFHETHEYRAPIQQKIQYSDPSHIFSDYYNDTTFWCSDEFGTESSLRYRVDIRYVSNVTIKAQIFRPSSTENIIWIDRDVLVVDKGANMTLTCSAQCYNISQCFYAWTCTQGSRNISNQSVLLNDLKDSRCQCDVSTFVNGSWQYSSRRVSIVVTYAARVEFDIRSSTSNGSIDVQCKMVENGFPLVQSVCLFIENQTCTSSDITPKSFGLSSIEPGKQTWVCRVKSEVGPNSTLLLVESVGYISCNEAVPMKESFNCLDEKISSLSCDETNTDSSLMYQWFMNASLLNATFQTKTINNTQNTDWIFLCVVRKDGAPIKIISWRIQNERICTYISSGGVLNISCQSPIEQTTPLIGITPTQNQATEDNTSNDVMWSTVDHSYLGSSTISNPRSNSGTAGPNSVIIAAVPGAIGGVLLILLLIIIITMCYRRKKNQKTPPTYDAAALSILDLANRQAQGDTPYCEFGGVKANAYMQHDDEPKKPEDTSPLTTYPLAGKESESESTDVESPTSIYAKPDSIKRATQRTSVQQQSSQPDQSIKQSLESDAAAPVNSEKTPPDNTS